MKKIVFTTISERVNTMRFFPSPLSILLIWVLFLGLNLSNAQAQSQCGIAPTGSQYDGVGFFGDNNVPTGAVSPHLKAERALWSNVISAASDMAAGAGATIAAAQHTISGSVTSNIDVSGVSGSATFAAAITNNNYVYTNVTPAATSYFVQNRLTHLQGNYTLGVAVFDGTTLTQLGTVAISTTSTNYTVTYATPYLMQGGTSYQIRFYYINATATTIWTDNPVLSWKASAVYPAPALSATSISGTCASPVNLTSITASNTPSSPSGTTLTWHTGTPVSSANKITGTGITTSGTYYAAFYDATASCYSTANTAVSVTMPACTAGTIDCSKTQLASAPVFGTASQLDLIVTVNVTTIGTFTPLSISGSGITLANGMTSVTTTRTGSQQFHIPVNYDGTTLGTMNYTIGQAGTCAADLTKTPKKAISDIWTLDCVPTVGPSMK